MRLIQMLMEVAIVMQDTPGFQAEGPETEAILAFINDGNVAYMNHEQVSACSKIY